MADITPTPDVAEISSKGGPPGALSGPQSAPAPSGPGALPAPDPSGMAHPETANIPLANLDPFGGPKPAPRPPSRMEKVASFITGGQGTPGQLFRGILAGAVTGMTAGAAYGHAGQGAAAGGEAARQMFQRQFENRLQLTREESEQKLRNFQIAHLTQQIAAEGWDLRNRQRIALEESAEYENKLRESAQKGNGIIFGAAETPPDVKGYFAAHPEIPKWMATGQIYGVPHMVPELDANGKPTGNQIQRGSFFAYIPTAWGDQLIDHDDYLPVFQPDPDATKPGKYIQKEVKAGTMTNREFLTGVLKQSADSQKYDSQVKIEEAAAKTEAAKARTAEVEARLAIAKGKLELEAKKNEQLVELARNDGRKLVEGELAPPNLGKRSKQIDLDIAAADEYSIAHYGKPWDWAKASSDWDDAQKFRGTMEAIATLVGPTGRGGTLDRLLAYSNTINRTDFPGINDAAQWAQIQLGDPRIPAYRQLATDVAERIAAVLQGGTGNASTDYKLKTAQDMLKAGFSKKALIEAASTLRGALADRQSGLTGNNQYLNRWFGPDSEYVRKAGGPSAEMRGGSTAVPIIPPGAQPMRSGGYVRGYTFDNGKTITYFDKPIDESTFFASSPMPQPGTQAPAPQQSRPPVSTATPGP